MICLESHFYFDSHNEEIVTTKVKTLKPSILVNVVCAIYHLIYLHFARSQNFTLVQLPEYRFICRCYDIQYPVHVTIHDMQQMWTLSPHHVHWKM